ncbi:uncharacterized protein C14orf119 homolog [Hypanus sabinus]|uniref:uncharacterized protein C14orf119 homolog n=1 Tax=Hypanus sabinus TaxID=79690 RepID=UPI0028C42122|nr:uncharacterized protein C14orf119 homolog [Hypanus sabinus]
MEAEDGTALHAQSTLRTELEDRISPFFPQPLHGMYSDPLPQGPSQQIACVVRWFRHWPPAQRECFLYQLLQGAVPGKAWGLLPALGALGVSGESPSPAQLQLGQWARWFQAWGPDDRNRLLAALEESEPAFADRFYRELAGSVGEA